MAEPSVIMNVNSATDTEFDTVNSVNSGSQWATFTGGTATINGTTTDATNITIPSLTYDYADLPLAASAYVEGEEINFTEASFVATHSFSEGYDYDKKKIDWKWYQPIKNWLKFNFKVLFS